MKETTQQRLQQIMSERNLKQVDILNMSLPFQKELKVSMAKNHLSQYVNGKSSPDQYKLCLLSRTLGVSEPWLLGYDVPRNLSKNISSIETIYNQLDGDRQTKVVNFAQEQLDEQNNNVLPLYRTKAADDVGTFAAHSVEDGKQFTDEEIAEADAYLQKLQEKFENKHKK
ncbi:MAG: helix-turn-helix domain-containing protein [Enterococcus sp.]